MDDTKQQLLEEWKDIRETLRYFGNKRFAQLTVFITVSGFMFDAFFKQTENSHRIALAVSGIFGSALFLIMEHSSVLYWGKFAERGKEIETTTGGTLKLMTLYRPSERFISATNATYALYAAVAVLWCVTLFSGKPKPTMDAVQIVETALQSAPGIAGKAKSEWALRSLTLDVSSQTYQLIVVDAGSNATLAMNLDAATGKIVKSEKAIK